VIAAPALGSMRLAEEPDPRIFSPHVVRNRAPILAVLRRMLPPTGLVVEVASGSGEQAVYFAERLPGHSWQPTDIDQHALASIAAHSEAAGLANLLPPQRLDATAERWPVERAAALVCINMIHIAPWTVTEGLMAGARRLLPAGGIVYLYGPYKIDGRHTAPSNQEFAAWLRNQNPLWGIRDVTEVTGLAARSGFALIETVPMPANNLSVIFSKREE